VGRCFFGDVGGQGGLSLWGLFSLATVFFFLGGGGGELVLFLFLTADVLSRFHG